MPRGIGLYAARQERLLVAAEKFLNLSGDSRQVMRNCGKRHEYMQFNQWHGEYIAARVELHNAVMAAKGKPSICDRKECAA
jgi:hypothetical protein